MDMVYGWLGTFNKFMERKEDAAGCQKMGVVERETNDQDFNMLSVFLLGFSFLTVCIGYSCVF